MTTNLKGLFLPEIAEALTPYGLPTFRARQIAEWLYRHNVTDFADMTNIPQKVRRILQRNFSAGGLTIVRRQRAVDGATVKFAVGLFDGQIIETVLMRHDYGNSVCVSSQVGCPMGCAFCASTLQGVVRNLTCGEMIDQVLVAARELQDTKQRVSHIVVMGSGEPLLNYDETLRFIRLCHEPYSLAIGYRHISISTCGVVPGIIRLAQEKLPITLSISLHAPNDAIRNRLLPVNKQYPLAVLMSACRNYIEITGRRVTFEYTMIAGINDQPAQARELAALLHGMLCHVNLIPVNPVEPSPLRRPAAGTVAAFAAVLQQLGVNVTVRREMGSEIRAACGQLRRQVLTPKEL